eukprot:CAMPEP_0174268146 /NCGR_PEP_ID=MMETSP0439-20130205/36345_1 /TAXON_ID=0 /ORGANISM="Stereomyxa ramosa, Strain Chinc5" /LENGTH=288 /DNA_ID=CAMNT_0015356137 /DNA_START=56 /DNA_END=922 /DNA_ORIENTATION=-
MPSIRCPSGKASTPLQASQTLTTVFRKKARLKRKRDVDDDNNNSKTKRTRTAKVHPLLEDNVSDSKWREMVVHCKQSHYDVYIGRENSTVLSTNEVKWGNPFKLGTRAPPEFGGCFVTRKNSRELYRQWLFSQPHLLQAARKELPGKVLGCWCAPFKCHGEILAEIANAGTTVGLPRLTLGSQDKWKKMVINTQNEGRNSTKCDVYIGRGDHTCKWGNPFQIGAKAPEKYGGKVMDRIDVVVLYRKYIMSNPDLILMAKRELRGKILGCWCAPQPCHGYVLAEIANGE